MLNDSLIVQGFGYIFSLSTFQYSETGALCHYKIPTFSHLTVKISGFITEIYSKAGCNISRQGLL